MAVWTDGVGRIAGGSFEIAASKMAPGSRRNGSRAND